MPLPEAGSADARLGDRAGFCMAEAYAIYRGQGSASLRKRLERYGCKLDIKEGARASEGPETPSYVSVPGTQLLLGQV